MKKTLLIALLLVPFFGISQTKKTIDGFLGIKFGTTRLAVIAAMKAKGATLDKENTNKETLAFNNVKLGSRRADGLFVYLTNGVAYSALFVFIPSDEPQIMEYYYGMVNDLNTVYGDGKQTKNIKEPYEDGDGHEVIAIQGGYSKYYTTWNSGENWAQVSIDNKMSSLSVLLQYEDGALSAQKKKKTQAEEKSDL